MKSEDWPQVACDGCGVHPIGGIRWKCSVCPNFDFCSKCEAKNTHPTDHPFLKMRPVKAVVHGRVYCNLCNEYPIRGNRYKCATCLDYDMCENCMKLDKHPRDHPLIMLRVPMSLPRQLAPLTAISAVPEASERPKQLSTAPSSLPQSPKPIAKTETKLPEQPIVRPGIIDSQPARNPESLKAHFGDENYPDGSTVTVGQKFTKIWSISNTGLLSWPKATKLSFKDGSEELFCSEQREFDLPVALAGSTVQIRVILCARKAGRFRTSFTLNDGRPFGVVLWVDVQATEELQKSPAVLPVANNDNLNISSASYSLAAIASSPVASSASAGSSVHSSAIAASATVVAGSSAAAAASAPSFASKYPAQMRELESMGFRNRDLNEFLLEKDRGNVQRVCDWLLENVSSSEK